MMKYINESCDMNLCKKILTVALIVYRPVILKKLKIFVEIFDNNNDDNDKELKDIIEFCSSLLTIWEDVVFFVY